MNYVPATWFAAKFPPDGEKGLWSREVLALSASGDVFRIRFFVPIEDGKGVWQRPKERASLGVMGRIVAWTELPKPLDFEL